MLQMRKQWAACALAVAGALVYGGYAVHADDHGHGDDQGDQGGHHARKVFVIALENHNWTQPASVTSPLQIQGNPAAPFINSLATGTSGISDQVAYATNYQNAAVGDHPSEPNYVWSEAGTNFGIANDDDPYHADCSPDTIQTTDQHLSGFLMKAGKTWKSYQEDVNVDLTTNLPLPMASWLSPLTSHSGNFTTGLNEYNFSHQYNYAAKHNPMVFFTDTAGPCPAAPSAHYPPLQQLALDLQSNQVADYNWITPDQYNDQHSALSAGYGSFVPASDQSSIAEGDNFVSRVVPLIMSSDAYRDGGIIVLWWDESEGGDSAQELIPFFVISRDVQPNVGGKPFASSVQYSHSSTLRTMQEIFDVDPDGGYPFLGGAATASDLSALFKPGAVSNR